MNQITQIAAGLVLAAGLAFPASAQELAMPEIAPDVASPFAFAEAGKKAARSAMAAEKADDSGARVIGGQPADEGEWPWQVALLINGGAVDYNSQFCGGSMVLDTWVLTAAHCVHMADKNGVYRDLNPQAISVYLGSVEIDPAKGDVIPVEAVYRYPDYVGTEFDNDIALIKLARAPRVPFETIKVPDAQFGDMLDQPGVKTVVTGWGLVEGGERTPVMREAEIQMMSRDMCNQMMLEARAKSAAQGIGLAAQAFGLKQAEAELVWAELIKYVRAPMSENMLCSGTFEGGKTSCNGDSGGPLVVPLGEGKFIQAGVVSWGMSSSSGKSCAENALFSAYTRVSNYVDWLNATVNAN
ncbi:serine protease [Shimia biformata]|uniref:serine protease n=1 Tax=Shimia biformata TaxID=1294299 RepID=UPI001951062A|nr:serine protease [Shimia biformata]